MLELIAFTYLKVKSDIGKLITKVVIIEILPRVYKVWETSWTVHLRISPFITGLARKGIHIKTLGENTTIMNFLDVR